MSLMLRLPGCSSVRSPLTLFQNVSFFRHQLCNFESNTCNNYPNQKRSNFMSALQQGRNNKRLILLVSCHLGVPVAEEAHIKVRVSGTRAAQLCSCSTYFYSLSFLFSLVCALHLCLHCSLLLALRSALAVVRGWGKNGDQGKAIAFLCAINWALVFQQQQQQLGWSPSWLNGVDIYIQRRSKVELIASEILPRKEALLLLQCCLFHPSALLCYR